MEFENNVCCDICVRRCRRMQSDKRSDQCVLHRTKEPNDPSEAHQESRILDLQPESQRKRVEQLRDRQSIRSAKRKDRITQDKTVFQVAEETESRTLSADEEIRVEHTSEEDSKMSKSILPIASSDTSQADNQCVPFDLAAERVAL